MDKSITDKFKEFGVDQLSETTGVSRSNIYSIIRGEVSPTLSTLEKLLKPMGLSLVIKNNLEITDGSINEEEFKEKLYQNLSFYGAPLNIKYDSSLAPLSINEVLLLSLKAGRRDSTINSILPFFIYKNWGNINWKEVVFYSDEKKYLGYLLNIIFYTTNDFEVNKILSKLIDEVDLKKVEKLIKRRNIIGPIMLKMFEATNNKIADNWKFQTTDALKDIEKRFLKWGGRSDGI